MKTRPDKIAMDLQGRPYARLSRLNAGDKVVVDGDFDCMVPWSEKTVHADGSGNLWIACSSREHGLDGSLMDDGDTLMGIYPEGTKGP